MAYALSLFANAPEWTVRMLDAESALCESPTMRLVMAKSQRV